MKIKLLLATLILAILTSCSSTKEMQVLVTRPAVFELPKDTKRIVLVNRSKGNALTILEGVLTGEIPGTDKVQSEQCMSGLQHTLNLNKNIEFTRHTVRLSSDRGSSTGFGNPLDWNTVNTLSKQYDADLLLVLEYFDTDYFVRDLVGSNATSNVYVRGTASAKAGFRLYDPIKSSILYEKTFSSSKNYTEFALTRLLALAKLTKGTEAVNDVSFTIGQNFAKRLIKYDVWEDRTMIKGKSGSESAKAERFVLTNNWEKGVENWLNAYKNTSSETEKGNIAYNLALGYEVLGDLQAAKKWITTSFVEHQNKKAESYSRTISNRIETEGILENQSKR